MQLNQPSTKLGVFHGEQAMVMKALMKDILHTDNISCIDEKGYRDLFEYISNKI